MRNDDDDDDDDNNNIASVRVFVVGVTQRRPVVWCLSSVDVVSCVSQWPRAEPKEISLRRTAAANATRISHLPAPPSGRRSKHLGQYQLAAAVNTTRQTKRVTAS